MGQRGSKSGCHARPRPRPRGEASIYLGTRSRRINRSAPANFVPIRVCLVPRSPPRAPRMPVLESAIDGVHRHPRPPDPDFIRRGTRENHRLDRADRAAVSLKIGRFQEDGSGGWNARRGFRATRNSNSNFFYPSRFHSFFSRSGHKRK